MKKTIITIFIAMALSLCFAETITLTNNQQIDAIIIGKNNDRLFVLVDYQQYYIPTRLIREIRSNQTVVTSRITGARDWFEDGYLISEFVHIQEDQRASARVSNRANNRIQVTITNRTGVAINSVHIKEHGTTSWGTSNLLSKNLKNGATRTVVLPATVRHGQYSLQLRVRKGASIFTKSNIKIDTVDNAVTFTKADANLVFYDKGFYSDGWRYLEAAPASSEFTATWGSTSVNISGTQMGIGTGRNNTNLIVARQGGPSATGSAAQRCAALNINGYSDWFLPSREELSLMYQHKDIIGFSIDSARWMNWVWSSSQSSTSNAWSQDFYSGHPSNNNKDVTNMVRAVRAF
jgi:hypothetical protein